MYTYSRAFIGIPLSQFDEDITPKQSKELIDELSEFVSDGLKFNTIEMFLVESSQELKQILNRLIQFRDNVEYLEFKDLKDNYNLDFFSYYNGADDHPLIFGFYIEDLFSIPISLGELKIDLNSINNLKERFIKFCSIIFEEKIFEQLMNDNLIGVFINNHSS